MVPRTLKRLSGSLSPYSAVPLSPSGIAMIVLPGPAVVVIPAGRAHDPRDRKVPLGKETADEGKERIGRLRTRNLRRVPSKVITRLTTFILKKENMMGKSCT
jgi:hypothetical protein